jgi:hypothetical protein
MFIIKLYTLLFIFMILITDIIFQNKFASIYLHEFSFIHSIIQVYYINKTVK